ncbi:hypothetical protein VSDKYIMU_CDS0149 [Enterococcus phage VRE9_4]
MCPLGTDIAYTKAAPCLIAWSLIWSTFHSPE